MGDATAAHMLMMLAHNSTLLTLDMDSNLAVDPDTMQRVIRTMKRRQRMRACFHDDDSQRWLISERTRMQSMRCEDYVQETTRLVLQISSGIADERERAQ